MFQIFPWARSMPQTPPISQKSLFNTGTLQALSLLNSLDNHGCITLFLATSYSTLLATSMKFLTSLPHQFRGTYLGDRKQRNGLIARSHTQGIESHAYKH